MIYKTNNDLPSIVQGLVPSSGGQCIVRRMLNKSDSEGLSTPRAFVRAYATLEKAGYTRNNRGSYVRINKSRGPKYGVMVALLLPEALAGQIAWPDMKEGDSGPFPRWINPDDLHITLCYLGKIDSMDLRRLGKFAEAVRKLVAQNRPVKATLGGLGRFDATESSDYMDVIYMRVISTQLPTLRAEIVAAAKAAGLKVAEDFEYTPHVSLAYATQSAPMPTSPVVGLDTEFGELSLCIGSAVQNYAFQSKGVETVEGTDDRFSRYVDQAEELALEFGGNIDAPFQWVGKITKLDTEQRIAFGWFSVIHEKGEQVVDSQGDLIDEAELEKAVYQFVLDSRTAGEIHRKDKDGKAVKVGRLIETIVFTAEKKAALGIEMDKVGWWGGFYVDDNEVWEKIKSGRYSCFSIGGMSRRLEA